MPETYFKCDICKELTKIEDYELCEIRLNYKNNEIYYQVCKNCLLDVAEYLEDRKLGIAKSYTEIVERLKEKAKKILGQK